MKGEEDLFASKDVLRQVHVTGSISDIVQGWGRSARPKRRTPQQLTRNSDSVKRTIYICDIDNQASFDMDSLNKPISALQP